MNEAHEITTPHFAQIPGRTVAGLVQRDGHLEQGAWVLQGTFRTTWGARS